MTSKYFFLSVLIASTSVITLVACSSDDDSDTNNEISNNPTRSLLFDEATNGDIVNDPNNPQPLQLVVGENSINAEVVAPDTDYLTVNVPVGTELIGIQVFDYISDGGPSFIAIQAGSVFTELPDDPMVGNLLGYLHFGNSSIDTNILPELAISEGAQGFTLPLSAGDYSLWIQETGDLLATYSLVFVVE